MRTTSVLRLTATLMALVLVTVWTGLALADDPVSDSTQQPADAKVASADTTTVPAHRVIAYYFHGNQRCATCYKLETYSKEAVDSAFADQLKAGTLEWRVINTDSAQNEHFIKDYQLYTKSVILSDVHSGTQTRWKNLEKIWELVGDRDKFRAYIQEEVAAYLKAE